MPPIADPAEEELYNLAILDPMTARLGPEQGYAEHPQLPEALRGKSLELRQTYDKLRENMRAVLEANRDASPEEKQAAVQVWRKENAGAIEAVQVMAQEIRKQVRDLGLDQTPCLDIPEKLQVKINQFHQHQATLNAEGQTIIEANQENPEALEAALTAWREENADRLAAQRERWREIAEAMKALAAGRTAPSAEIMRLRQRINEMAQEENARFQAFNGKSQAAAEEDRDEMRAQFQKEIQELIQEREELQRQLREIEKANDGEGRGSSE